MKCPWEVQRNNGSIVAPGSQQRRKLLKKNLAAKLAKLKNKKKEAVADPRNNATADLASKAKLLKESLKNKIAKLKTKDTNGAEGEVVQKERSVDKGTKQNPYLAHRNTTGRLVDRESRVNTAALQRIEGAKRLLSFQHD